MKQLRLLVIALLLVLLTGAAASAGPVTIAVQDKTTVAGAVITLGEIAAINGNDQSEVEILQAAKLGNAPAPGSSMTLTRELLGLRLAAAGVDFSSVVWQIPATMVITAASQTVSGDQLASVAKQAVMKQTAGYAGETVISLAASPPDFLAPVGNLDYTVHIPGGVRFAGAFAANVTVAVEGRQFTTVPVKLEAKLYEQVVVAIRPIAAQEIIDAEDLRIERLDVSRLTGYMTDIGKAAGMVSRRPIALGTPITGSMVAKPVLIKRGSLVTLISRVGGVEASAAAQALQDGVQNQIIRVKNMNTQKIVVAQVIDDSTVLVKTYTEKGE